MWAAVSKLNSNSSGYFDGIGALLFALYLIVLDSKSAMCMAKNGRDTKHTRHIARRMNFVRNGEKCKMHKIEWCEGGLQLADIGTKNVSETDLTPRMKYIMIRLEN